MGHGRRLAVALLFAGCGSGVDASSSGDGDGSGDDDVDTTADAGTEGSNTTASSTSGDDPLRHGSVGLLFRRSDNQASNPTVGVVELSVTMTYRECLSEFYDAYPSMRQTGPEGEAVFGTAALGGEGWMGRLCDSSQFSEITTCTVAQIQEQLDPVPQLTVVYAIAGELEDRELRFGPLPTKEAAGCPDPIVRASVGGIVGYDMAGETVVAASAVSPTSAVTDQGGSLVVELAAVD
jgi:hypothetical protein